MAFSSYFSVFRSFVQKRFWHWVERRIEAGSEQVFRQNNIYVLPTRFGVGFIVLIMFLFLTAVNYQNNLLYIASFFFVAVFVVSILATYRNISGLVMRAESATDNFVGQPVSFELSFRKLNGEPSYALVLSNDQRMLAKADVGAGEKTTVVFNQVDTMRGKKTLDRVRISSTFPLGLIEAWSYARLVMDVWVYPKPQQLPIGASDGAEGDEDSGASMQKGLDISGIKDYVPGDTLSQVSWKHFASRNELYVKEREPLKLSDQLLDYDALTHFDKEQRLCILSFWVNHFYREGRDYRLRLPGIQLAQGNSDAYYLQCMRALAEY